MSNKPIVLVTRRLPDAVEVRLSRDYNPRFNPDDMSYGGDELIFRAEGAAAVIACHTDALTADVIDRLPDSVKAICNFSVGYNHVDVEAAKRRSLIVTNTPDVLSDATAEIAILCMLGASRRVVENIRLLRESEWRDWSPTYMLGTQMTGKRLGVIGMGRVGQVTARRARGFDMIIHYHNRSPLNADQEAGAIYHDSLESLLPHCDFLSIHCPATAESEGLLNADRIALLPDGAVVVNTVRGPIIDDEALIAALTSGKLFAAGLDVFNNEPQINSAYRRMENVFALPHIGSATQETRNAMGFRALDNLDAIVAGREPGDRVA